MNPTTSGTEAATKRRDRRWLIASIATAVLLLLGVPALAGFFGNLAALIGMVVAGPAFMATLYRAIMSPLKRRPSPPSNAIQDLIDWKRRRNLEALREWDAEWDRLDPTRKLHAGSYITTNESRTPRGVITGPGVHAIPVTILPRYDRIDVQFLGVKP